MYFNFFQVFSYFRFNIINSIDEKAAAAWAQTGTWWLTIYRSGLVLGREAFGRK